MKVTSLLFVVALAAGIPAAAQSTPQAPAQPPASAQAPQTVPPGQAAGAAVQPAPPPAVPATRKFTGDAGVMFSQIYPTKTADFEAVLARVKEALNKSQDPKRKQQALSWKVYKGVETGPGGAVFYLWWFDPPVKDIEYSITQILTEAFPNEAQDLWAKYVACFAQPQSLLNLQQVLTMSAATALTVPK